MTPINLDDLAELPTLQPSVMKILRDIDKGETDAAGLAESVQSDIGLTARILRVANSSFYGLSSQVGSIKEACVLLGMHTVRNLIVSSAVVDRLTSPGDTGFDCMSLWRHGLGTAAVGVVLAKRTGMNEGCAFTGGLLHDLGRVVLAIHFPKRFAAVLRYRDEHGCLMYEAEQAVLGTDHCAAGERLAKKWNFPDAVCKAIGSHHRPGTEPKDGLVRLVHVADIVCRGLGLGDEGSQPIPPVDAGAVERLGLDWNRLGGLLGEMEATYRSLSPLLESADS